MSEVKTKPSVLLVAKSAMIVKSVGKLLSEYFNLISVNDAETAWDALLEATDSEIAVVICELQSSIDGFGLLERLRSAGNNHLAGKPVLLLVSENDSEESRERAFQRGATDFINMPFSTTELTTRVRLHAQYFVQHSQIKTPEIQQDTSLNVLQQLAQENYFESRLNQEIAFSLRHKMSIGVCKIKISNLKALVAEKGKPATMVVVQTVAKSIQKTMRCEDTLCYLGNAEFNLLFPATNGIGSAIGLRRIMDAVGEQKIPIEGKAISVPLAAAIYSCVPSSSTTIEVISEVLRSRLDEALAHGGNSIVSSKKGGGAVTISVEKALQMLERDDTNGLSVYAKALMISLLPFIEYADEELNLGLQGSDLQLRKKLLQNH
ncbi:MAG: two-component system cell cycle response regulator [Gammaproteobacteria bacterium]|jgi:diguanylate cyclase (GGDEF)-like protein